VGSGFSDSELQRLAQLLAPLERPNSPFTAGRETTPRRQSSASRELVVEVEFAHWTAQGSLRHPYKGLREDKPAEQVMREEATVGLAPEAQTAAQRRSTARCPCASKAPK
jgi:bifunctional non-homologous end joining protein LigD